MKTNIRSRRLVLDSIKQTDQKKLETPNRLLPSRFILRANQKQEEHGKQIPLQPQLQKQIKTVNSHFATTQNREEYEYNQPIEYLQARDRRTILKYDFRQRKFHLENQREKLNQWLGEMHFKIVSASFNLYLGEDLTFQQVKVHCCQNLLLNILNFLESLTANSDNSLYNSRMQRQSLSYLQMTEILKHINQVLIKNLAYMQIKYPLTKDSKPNKTLQSLITKINNLGNDQHDIVMKSKVQFKLKDNGNYTSQIMKFINFLITKQTQFCGIKGNNKKQLTYFQFFYQTMQRIFTSIYKPDVELKDNQNDLENHQESPAAIFGKIMSQNVIQNQPQLKTKEEKQYKQKVMKYTHYLIGRKISGNTQLYSDKEIQTQIFDVKNSSILRILTKWTEQLQGKILKAQQQILKRPFRFKRNKQAQFSKLNANQKNDLYQQANRRAKEVASFNEQLKQNYNQIEAMLSSHLRQGSQYKNIPKNEYKVGFFCSKIQAAASSTLLSYLNKIIHILLLVPEQLKKMHVNDEQYIENMNINLITFKISDLFRCKIKSREAEIIRLFKQIKIISERGQPFKIVRIKDRLSQGTRDIMVNILFKGIFLCQIQLAIEEYVETKQQSYDTFSHFLYEMHRSRLGPIMQSACTWAQFDQRVKIFRQINDSSTKSIKSNIQHGCDKQFFIVNQYPFVCSLCQKFYSTQVGLISHKKCVLCKAYYECSLCIYNKMGHEEISKLLNLNSLLGIFKNDFRLWSYDQQQQKQQRHRKHRKFPLFGLIISKKMKKPEIVFFQTIIFKYDTYIIQLKYNEQEKEDQADIIIIEKIQGNSQKIIKQIAQKYIIYEWKEQKYTNKRIMPQNMKKVLEEQKNKRDELARLKRIQKQKKKLQLQKKRQEEQQRVAKFLKRGDDDKKEKKEKQEKQEKQQKQQEEERPKSQQTNKIVRYNQNLFKRNQFLQVRVIEKQIDDINETFVLGIFLKQYTIRNKLKKINNQNILQHLRTRKIEVLFMQDEFIHDQINKFDQIPQTQQQQLRQTFQGISQVYFDNNYFEDLSFLQIIRNVKVAHFSHNLISNLDPFFNLGQLTQLILEDNKISNIEGLIKNKPQLIQLNLNRNEISQLSAFALISNNSMFKSLTKLKNLYINDNCIQSMKGIQGLSELVKLDLSFNKIAQIAQITTLINLQQLDLSANQIKKMKGISNFIKLKKVFLNNNDIKIISKQMTKFNCLAIINLSDNQIKKIQHLSTGNFAKTLKILNLTDNKIQKMQGLDTLQNLQQLYLGNNQIQSINNYLDLVSLKVLDLSYNSIQQLDLEEVQKDLPCLKKLNISSNIINSTDSNRSNLEYLTRLFGDIHVTFKKQL